MMNGPLCFMVAAINSRLFRVLYFVLFGQETKTGFNVMCVGQQQIRALLHHPLPLLLVCDLLKLSGKYLGRMTEQ